VLRVIIATALNQVALGPQGVKTKG